MNYSQEALNLIRIKDVLRQHMLKMNVYTQRTQIAYATAIMNYSEYLYGMPT